ncbi:hypothetical protein BH20ACT2_BH20ACT2_13150 [soil metagenome]
MTSEKSDPPRRRALDGRILAIAVVVALLAAAGAALAYDTFATGGDDPPRTALGAGDGGGGEVSLDPVGEGGLTGGDVTGEAAPGVTFAGFDGEERTLDEYRGEPLVVNFFATWCPPCVREMPAFEEVNQRRDDIAFLGISTQETADDGRRLIERTGVTYDVGRDPQGELLAAFEPLNMPTTALIRADGTVAAVHTGELSADELDALIDANLT